jgi:hypothetical protein
LYEYATYSDFVQFPTHRIRVSDDWAQKRLQALALYKSQKQIGLIVDALQKAGGIEFLLEVAFEVFSPQKYAEIF